MAEEPHLVSAEVHPVRKRCARTYQANGIQPRHDRFTQVPIEVPALSRRLEKVHMRPYSRPRGLVADALQRLPRAPLRRHRAVEDTDSLRIVRDALRREKELQEELERRLIDSQDDEKQD